MKRTLMALMVAAAGCGGGGSGSDDPAPSAPPSQPPSASVTSPTGTQSGPVVLAFQLDDPEGDLSSILVEYSVDGGVNWLAANPGPGSDGVANLPSGQPVQYVWNAFDNGIGTGGPVAARLRITPSDAQSAGDPVETGDFVVDNSANLSGGSLSGFPVLSNPSADGDDPERLAINGRYLYVFGRWDTVFGPAADYKLRVEKRGLIDGALDYAVTWNPTAGKDRPEAIVIDSTHMYLAIYQETAPGSYQFEWRIEKRSLADGSLDAGFGAGGVILTGNIGDEAALNLTIDGGNLYLIGAELETAPDDFRTRIEKRSTSDGSLVPAFGTNGVLLQNLDANADGAVAAVVANGALYVSAVRNAMVDSVVRLERRSLADGSLDWVVESNPTTGDDMADSMVADGTFAYLLIRSESVSELSIQKRSLVDGSLAANVTSTITGVEDERLAGDEENLYIAYGFEIAPGNKAWRIEKRVMLDLALDTAFDGDGIVEIDPSTAWEAPHDIGASNGVVYVTGVDNAPGDGQWRIEARYR